MKKIFVFVSVFALTTIMFVGCKSHKEVAKEENLKPKPVVERPIVEENKPQLKIFTNADRLLYHYSDKELIRENGIGPLFFNKKEIQLKVMHQDGMVEIIRIPALTPGRAVAVDPKSHDLQVIFSEIRPIEIRFGSRDSLVSNYLSLGLKQGQQDSSKVTYYLKYNNENYEYINGYKSEILVDPKMYLNREFILEGVK